MSIDRSLKTKSTLTRHRNVLTRAERVARLRDLGRWTDEMSPLGMPKVSNRRVRAGGKKKAKGAGEEA